MYINLLANWKEGRKEMLYLMMHSTYFIYSYMVKDIIMAKDHSDSKSGNPITSKGSFIYIILQRITHTMAFGTPVMEHWLEQEIAQWVHHEGLIQWPTAP